MVIRVGVFADMVDASTKTFITVVTDYVLWCLDWLKSVLNVKKKRLNQNLIKTKVDKTDWLFIVESVQEKYIENGQAILKIAKKETSVPVNAGKTLKTWLIKNEGSNLKKIPKNILIIIRSGKRKTKKRLGNIIGKDIKNIKMTTLEEVKKTKENMLEHISRFWVVSV